HLCFFVVPLLVCFFFFFSSRRRHTRSKRDWSSDVCSSDLASRSFPARSTLLDTPLSRLAGRAALLFGAMFVVALVVVLRPAPWLALFERVTRTVLPARLAARVAGMAEGLVAGLTVLKRPGRFGAMLFWSLVLWLTNAASFAV